MSIIKNNLCATVINHNDVSKSHERQIATKNVLHNFSIIFNAYTFSSIEGFCFLVTIGHQLLLVVSGSLCRAKF